MFGKCRMQRKALEGSDSSWRNASHWDLDVNLELTSKRRFWNTRWTHFWNASSPVLAAGLPRGKAVTFKNVDSSNAAPANFHLTFKSRATKTEFEARRCKRWFSEEEKLLQFSDWNPMNQIVLRDCLGPETALALLHIGEIFKYSLKDISNWNRLWLLSFSIGSTISQLKDSAEIVSR